MGIGNRECVVTGEGISKKEHKKVMENAKEKESEQSFMSVSQASKLEGAVRLRGANGLKTTLVMCGSKGG